MTTKKSTKKTASRRVYVKATDGEKLQLKRGRLTQTADSQIACYATFEDIRKAVVGGDGLTVRFVDGNGRPMSVSFYPQTGIMGCCEFNASNFNKIMRAARSSVRFGVSV